MPSAPAARPVDGQPPEAGRCPKRARGPGDRSLARLTPSVGPGCLPPRIRSCPPNPKVLLDAPRARAGRRLAPQPAAGGAGLSRPVASPRGGHAARAAPRVVIRVVVRRRPALHGGPTRDRGRRTTGGGRVPVDRGRPRTARLGPRSAATAATRATVGMPVAGNARSGPVPAGPAPPPRIDPGRPGAREPARRPRARGSGTRSPRVRGQSGFGARGPRGRRRRGAGTRGRRGRRGRPAGRRRETTPSVCPKAPAVGGTWPGEVPARSCR